MVRCDGTQNASAGHLSSGIRKSFSTNSTILPKNIGKRKKRRKERNKEKQKNKIFTFPKKGNFFKNILMDFIIQ